MNVHTAHTPLLYDQQHSYCSWDTFKYTLPENTLISRRLKVFLLFIRVTRHWKLKHSNELLLRQVADLLMMNSIIRTVSQQSFSDTKTTPVQIQTHLKCLSYCFWTFIKYNWYFLPNSKLKKVNYCVYRCCVAWN